MLGRRWDVLAWNNARLVARLTRLSPEFAQWWPQREVARPLAGEKRIDHPTAGRMLFEYSNSAWAIRRI